MTAAEFVALAVPLWILVYLSIWNVARSLRAERKYNRDVDEANELMRAGQEMLRRYTRREVSTPDGETLH